MLRQLALCLCVVPLTQALALNVATAAGDVGALKDLSNAFLESGPEAVLQSPLGFLTSLFVKISVGDVVT